MRFRSFIPVVLAFSFLGGASAVAQAQQSVVGVWERISLRDREGKVTQPPLAPQIAIFSADGYFMQTAILKERKKHKKAPKDMSKEELLERYQDVTARYGTYKHSGGKLVRTDVFHTNPDLQGRVTDQTIKFEKNVIVLGYEGTKFEARFRRVK